MNGPGQDGGLDLDDVPAELRAAAAAALEAAGVDSGHLSLEMVGEERIHELNREYRDRDKPTDVLSFPIDGAGPVAGPRELGDVVICPEHTEDVVEATVHGVLHLCGFDHEEDSGEMLELQARVLASLARPPMPIDSSASRPGSPPMPVDSSASRPGSPPMPVDSSASRPGSTGLEEGGA